MGAFDICEAVEDGGAFVLVECVDFGLSFEEEAAELGGAVEVGRVEDQVVQRGALV